ncbi:MAG: Lysine decarboxylase family [Micavibrio sp.]|nr:Lysine decarboxylase family [Micavibrio sp.]
MPHADIETKTKFQNICVYCGSSGRAPDVYKDAAVLMGKILGEAGHTLVYGGGSVGLMGLVANSTLSNGGTAIGIIPRHIEAREIGHPDLTELHVVDSMHVRKQMMVDRSDAFIILPGGIGTMDEFFEIMTWRQLGLHDKPIVIVNVNGYWTTIIETLEVMVREKFLRQEDRDTVMVVERPEDVLEALQIAPREMLDPKTKWI